MQLRIEVMSERVRQEIDVRRLQGYDVEDCFATWEQVRDHREGLIDLQKALSDRPLKPDWTYQEPSDLQDIREARPQSPKLPDFYLAESEILNKIHGAWLGRIAGCILGKPLEMGLSQDDIRAYLEGANAYPLKTWVPAQSRYVGHPLRRDCVPSMLGHVCYAQEDDDLNYMCLAVKLLEKHGRAFTTLDVGMNWLESIPFLWTWGPEHVVYLNLAEAVGEHHVNDLDLEAVTGYFNPGTDWIGAQIRADVYGYVCPGNPELAAELAWRDAYLTHRMSGIYGAMWVAAMNASAFTLLDMEDIILSGLAQIPAKSRFAEAILCTMDWYHQDGDWQKTGRRIVEHFDQYGFAGAINNACCVTTALLHGAGDSTLSAAEVYERTITTAVQLGYDTDCNGATAGSIIGMILGASLLPEKWTAPLNDTLRTCVAQFGQVGIAEMAQRTHQLSRIIGARTAQHQ